MSASGDTIVSTIKQQLIDPCEVHPQPLPEVPYDRAMSDVNTSIRFTLLFLEASSPSYKGWEELKRVEGNQLINTYMWSICKYTPAWQPNGNFDQIEFLMDAEGELLARPRVYSKYELKRIGKIMVLDVRTLRPSLTAVLLEYLQNIRELLYLENTQSAPSLI